MDIEGGEYNAILSMSMENLKKFKYIIIEFHDLHQFINPIVYSTFFSTFNKILSQFNIVHIHPNNYSKINSCYEFQIPRALEFTFMNKTCNIKQAYIPTFPHKLDSINNPNMKEIVLPTCWQPFNT
jgi:hypothetical protein